VGKLLIVFGLIVVALGAAIQLGVPLGRLPGDIVIKRENTTIYIPVVTCLLISILLSIVTMLMRR
jgi:hypothetical protein